MAERSKAADCKSVSNTHVGSNPTFLNCIFVISPKDKKSSKKVQEL
jgi:hypothetical protein